MAQTFREAFSQAVENTGTPMTKIAEATGVSYDQLKKLKQRPSGSTNVDDAIKIAAFFGVTISDFMEGRLDVATNTVSIAGTVGAGARVPVFDAYEKGDGPQVVCPPGLNPHGVVAVEIEGDSMEPVYSAGDLLFYTRHTHEGVPSEALGRRCVCEDLSGMGWVKQVKPGDEPGLFHLISLNPGAQNIWNTGLRWAAPVRLHWPAELVRRA